MMTERGFRWQVAFAAMSVLLFSATLHALPDIHPPVQFITVQATQPLATEPAGDAGTFTISRAGNTNSTVTVPFVLGGTASNGVDYQSIALSVTLQPGQVSTNLSVTPVSEPSATGYKTVAFTLPRRETNFIVASPDRAVVYIVYNYTNVPPNVSIVTPTNGQTYLSLPNIEIAANAFDSNGWVTSVEFFANGAEIGVVTNNPFWGAPRIPFTFHESHGAMTPIFPRAFESRYQFVWTNVPVGAYNLTAVATDNAGLQTTSDSVTITVTTNLPAPQVRIVNPGKGAEFSDLSAINLLAAAGEMGGTVQTVEFLANGESLGVVTNYLAAEPASLFRLRMQWLPYYFRWTNAPVGSNSVTAVATDNNGTTATSAPVSIMVTTNVYHGHRGWGWGY
jgi:hypothetical protein